MNFILRNDIFKIIRRFILRYYLSFTYHKIFMSIFTLFYSKVILTQKFITISNTKWHENTKIQLSKFVFGRTNYCVLLALISK